MNVYVTLLSVSTSVMALLFTRLAEQYPESKIDFIDQGHFRLVDKQRVWVLEDKVFFEQLVGENLIARWSVTNIPISAEK